MVTLEFKAFCRRDSCKGRKALCLYQNFQERAKSRIRRSLELKDKEAEELEKGKMETIDANKDSQNDPKTAAVHMGR